MRFTSTLYQLIIAFLVILLCLQQCSSCTAVNGLNRQLDELRAARPNISVSPVQNSRLTASDTTKRLSHETEPIVKTKLVPYRVVDSFVSFEPLPFDTAGFIATLPRLNYFSDTAKTKYGNMVVQDTIAGIGVNVLGRGYYPDFYIPTTTITNTVTNTVEAKPRTQVYFTLMATGSQNLPLERLGGGFTLKTKKDALWHLYSLLDANGGLHFQAGRSWKISFKH